jgi:hypothetical protein
MLFIVNQKFRAFFLKKFHLKSCFISFLRFYQIKFQESNECQKIEFPLKYYKSKPILGLFSLF